MLAIDDFRGYSANAILRDGTPVCIRAIRPDDKERLVGHFDRLSSDSRYHRFFGFRNAFTPRELSCFTEPDFLRHVALVATIEEGTGDWRDCTDQLDRSEIRRIVAQGELVRIRHRGEVVARVKEVDAAGAVAAIAASNEAFRVWRPRQSRGPSPAAAGRGRSSSV
jgi:hypothetical protein